MESITVAEVVELSEPPPLFTATVTMAASALYADPSTTAEKSAVNANPADDNQGQPVDTPAAPDNTIVTESSNTLSLASVPVLRVSDALDGQSSASILGCPSISEESAVGAHPVGRPEDLPDANQNEASTNKPEGVRERAATVAIPKSLASVDGVSEIEVSSDKEHGPTTKSIIIASRLVYIPTLQIPRKTTLTHQEVDTATSSSGLKEILEQLQNRQSITRM